MGLWPLRWGPETVAGGVAERAFALGDVPGTLWSPVDSDGDRPLVLLAHGGGEHRRAGGVLVRARNLVSSNGFAVAALDAPDHGDRPRNDEARALRASLRDRLAAGVPVDSVVAAHMVALADRAVPEWQALLDGLRSRATGPVGFCGFSLGAVIGLRLIANNPRVIAAVIGLVGHDTLVDLARSVTVPMQFLLQRDDQLVPYTAGLAIYEAIASPQKSLLVNPGGHADLPSHEPASTARFFARHLAPTAVPAESGGTRAPLQ